MEFHKICVLGLGYIGLPTASTFATHGVRVVGVDNNLQVVHTLRNGGLHIQEPGLRDLVQAALSSGNLAISAVPEEADAFVIAVPTPFYADKRADLRAVIDAARSIVPYLRPGNLVVLESTSPPRTTLDVLVPILEGSGLAAGAGFFLAYSPERVLPGRILQELVENARVIGGFDAPSAEAGRDLYRLFVRGEIVLTDATTAEMVKLMENTYRDVNIAIANEFSRLAQHFGTDIWEVIAIANRHPRVNILQPGAGVGGHCIGVDPWFLVEAAPEKATLIRAARQVNDSQPNVVADLVGRTLGNLQGVRIAAFGLSYKPDVDDLRESPAIEVARLLVQAGAQVTACEPHRPDFQAPGLAVLPAWEAAVAQADALLLLVGHRAFRALDPLQVASRTPARVAIDAVNGWDAAAWKRAGFAFHRLGDGKSAPTVPGGGADKPVTPSRGR